MYKLVSFHIRHFKANSYLLLSDSSVADDPTVGKCLLISSNLKTSIFMQLPHVQTRVTC